MFLDSDKENWWYADTISNFDKNLDLKSMHIQEVPSFLPTSNRGEFQPGSQLTSFAECIAPDSNLCFYDFPFRVCHPLYGTNTGSPLSKLISKGGNLAWTASDNRTFLVISSTN